MKRNENLKRRTEIGSREGNKDARKEGMKELGRK